MEVLGSHPVSWVCDRKAPQRPQRVQLNLTSPWGWCQACHQHEWLLFSFGSCSYTAFFPSPLIKKQKKQANIIFKKRVLLGVFFNSQERSDFLINKRAKPVSFLAFPSAQQALTQWMFWKTTPRDSRRQPWLTTPGSGKACSPRWRRSLCPRGSRYDLPCCQRAAEISDSLGSRMLMEEYFR